MVVVVVKAGREGMMIVSELLGGRNEEEIVVMRE